MTSAAVLMDSPHVSILISSFDGYSDCWLAVCHGIRKYWPDCPYPVYLMTNHKDFVYPGISVLKVGEDTGWSGRMLKALDRIETPYVLYFQEDYWIMAPVDTARVQEYAALMERCGLDYIRFVSNPEPDFDFPEDPRLGLIGPTAPYRTSAQVSLWRKQVLTDLIVPGETVWQFEVGGSARSRRYGPTFLSTKKKGQDDFYYGIRYLCTAVNAGRWFRAAKVYARAEGLDVDFSRLPSETWRHDFRRTATGRALGLWTHRLATVVRNPFLALGKVRHRLRAGKPG